jgi:hypothetical protein
VGLKGTFGPDFACGWRIRTGFLEAMDGCGVTPASVMHTAPAHSWCQETIYAGPFLATASPRLFVSSSESWHQASGALVAHTFNMGPAISSLFFHKVSILRRSILVLCYHNDNPLNVVV